MKRTNGVTEEIKMALENVPGIRYAFIYGSSANNPEDHEREVDIMVLGGPDLVEMDEAISEVEERLGRPFLITSFTVREIQERIRMKDEAILRVLEDLKNMLLGDEEEMKAALSAEA
jgi:predicted nucleotidyltransferase